MKNVIGVYKKYKVMKKSLPYIFEENLMITL